MKTIIVLATLVAATLAIPADTYNPAYDNYNIEEVVANVRLLENLINCFLKQGPCTAEGKDIKKVIPEALKTSCAKCTPKQRVMVRTAVNAFQEKLPAKWSELVKQEDPTGEHKEAFDAFLHSTD